MNLLMFHPLFGRGEREACRILCDSAIINRSVVVHAILDVTPLHGQLPLSNSHIDESVRGRSGKWSFIESFVIIRRPSVEYQWNQKRLHFHNTPNNSWNFIGVGRAVNFPGHPTALYSLSSLHSISLWYVFGHFPSRPLVMAEPAIFPYDLWI